MNITNQSIIQCIYIYTKKKQQNTNKNFKSYVILYSTIKNHKKLL